MGVDAHDLERLRRALALAPKGRHRVEPNPTVGCVLEHDGRVVGEGWHAAYGGPHAEIMALDRAGEAARGATAYVTLEPCSRTSKTGPCTVALARAGVRRVVFAAIDPNEAGAGKARLEDAGIEVEGPVLEAEGRGLMGPFLWSLRATRPWVVLKWAMTLDGRIAEASGRGGVITGEASRALVHEMRAHADAVLVGVGTVLADDPRLTVRAEGPARPQPARVVFDSTLRTPLEARLFEDLPEAPLLFVAGRPSIARRRAFEARGAEVLEVPDAEGRVDPHAALEALHARGVHRLLVEGGARIHGTFFRDGLVDTVATFVAPRVFGNEAAPSPVAGAAFPCLADAARLEDVVWRRVGDDLLVEGRVSG